MEKLQGIKLLEKRFALNAKNIDARDIMKLFFVLYDFRIVLDHKLSDADAKEKMDSCYTLRN
jgi:hypothetical protein